MLPTNDLGLVVRALPVAAELKKRGYQVLLSHPSPAGRQTIEAAGFDNLLPTHLLYDFAYGAPKSLWSTVLHHGGPVRFVYDLMHSYPYRRLPDQAEIWNTDHAAAIMGLLNSGYIESQVIAYQKVILKSKCDLVIDFWNPFSCIAAKSLGIPLATINQADALPGSRGFIWWKQPDRRQRSVVPALNQVLQKFKLHPINAMEEIFVGDCTLVTGMPETDPLPSSTHFQYVGDLLWNHPGKKLEPWLEYLSSASQVIWLYPGNPTYGGLSRIFDSLPMLTTCIEALGHLSEPVVLSMGHHQLPRSLGKLPDNFYAFPFLPGLAMAKKCSVMIHHGGYGSCQTSLLGGAPSLILPTLSERESNARRLVQLGAGELVLPVVRNHQPHFDPEEVIQKVRRIIATPAYRQRARELGAQLVSYGGPVKAVDILEETLLGHAPAFANDKNDGRTMKSASR